jgi:hypothetical protein
MFREHKEGGWPSNAIGERLQKELTRRFLMSSHRLIRAFLAVSAIALAFVLGPSVIGDGRASTAEAKNGQTLSVAFGEPQGSLDGRCDPSHLDIENPGTVDKKSTITFDMNQLAAGTLVNNRSGPPACTTLVPPMVPCTGTPTCDAFHQVVVMNEGVTVADLPPIPSGQRYVLLGTGPEQTTVAPPDAGWLNDPLPANVAAAAVIGKDLTFEFQKKGRYLVLCNVASHFAEGMYTYIEVEQVNLNKP